MCFGDLNREYANLKKGGGAACINNYSLALALSRMVLKWIQYDKFWTYLDWTDQVALTFDVDLPSIPIINDFISYVWHHGQQWYYQC